ncbi:hypothetical protein SRHO_G00005670 [Serrasalmus rhombeus]
MRDVLREPTTFKWTDKAQKSFQKVKELITKSSALALFDPALPTIVSTDASDYGIGGVLSQLHPDNTEKTVAFASCALTPTERKYSVVEKEALACIWTTERWRTYLWGTKFTLKTDHQALTTLLATRGMGCAGLRIARWSARLLCFNYDIAYRDELTSHKELILRGSHRLLVPLNLRSHMVSLAHESHQSIVRTKQRLRDLYWCPRMDSLVQSTIAACVTCQLNDKTARTAPAPLTPVEYPDGPWKKLAMDIVGPFEIDPAECKFALTLVDYYSK